MLLFAPSRGSVLAPYHGGHHCFAQQRAHHTSPGSGVPVIGRAGFRRSGDNGDGGDELQRPRHGEAPRGPPPEARGAPAVYQ